jgi:hypothetical protein
MMGVRTPETCWTVNKIKIINWRTFASSWWFIWIMSYVITICHCFLLSFGLRKTVWVQRLKNLIFNE